MSTTKRPKLNPEILEEVFHEVKIAAGNEEEPEEYLLTPFMLAGKESFNLTLNFYNQMKEATIGHKCIVYKNYRDEEYTIYRKFPLFKTFGQILLASVEKIKCLRNYPKDLPLFKNVKQLKELIADAFFVLTYSKQFSSIEFIERVELSTNFKDMMDIHKLPFQCEELCLKDYGFSRFMKTKFKKLSTLNEDFASKTSTSLNSIKKLSIEDYIDEADIPNIQFNEIATCFSRKFQSLQSFTVIFIVFMQDNLDVIGQFNEEFVQGLNGELPNIQFTINFELYLSCLKQSHVDFYDAIIQDNQNYQINQEEKTARRIISADKCTLDILFSFG